MTFMHAECSLVTLLDRLCVLWDGVQSVVRAYCSSEKRPQPYVLSPSALLSGFDRCRNINKHIHCETHPSTTEHTNMEYATHHVIRTAYNGGGGIDNAAV